MLCLLLLSCVNLFNSVAFHPFNGWQEQKDSSSLRILTWNTANFVDVNYGSPTKDSMLRLIQQSNADILCLQEVINNKGYKRHICISDTLSTFGYKYFAFSGDEYKEKETRTSMHGVFIFSKIPFTKTDTLNILNNIKHENLASATIQFNGRPLKFNTAHLASFGLYTDTAADDKSIYELTYERKRSIQHLLRSTEVQHQYQAQKIRSYLDKDSGAQIYCGDLNTMPASYNYRKIKNGWQDAYLQKGFGIGNTFYQILPTLRIDVMLLSNQLQVQQCKVIRRKLSDHYAVIADVKWK